METTRNISQEYYYSKAGENLSLEYGYDVQTKLREYISYPWMTVVEPIGIHVLLLSRKQVKAVQRGAYFSYSGEEKITVHCKPVPKSIADIILQCETPDKILSTERTFNEFVQRIVTVVKRLQSYEVCVGVDEVSYEPLWELEKDGDIEKDIFKELRYQNTFRPSGCHLLVSGDGYLKRRCPVCIQAKIRFTAKMARRKHCIASSSTPNMHLSRNQLLKKLQVQQKMLKCNRDQIAKLKAKLQKATSLKGIHIDDSLSEELVSICMNYVISDS